MVTHHTQLKQKKSLDILDRALDYLIEAECPLELNGKMYKKINMSYGQILDAMHHVATPEEESGELIWTNSSSLSQYSKDYIEQAKDKRNNRYLEKIGYKTDKKISSLDKDIAIENLVVGNRLGDMGNAVQNYVEGNGFSVVREFCGHGVGLKMHEEPMVPNFGRKGRGLRVENGMVLAIEPMVNVGTYKTIILSDGWTAVTKDGKRSAHFEHSVAIIDGKAVILSEYE